MMKKILVSGAAGAALLTVASLFMSQQTGTPVPYTTIIPVGAGIGIGVQLIMGFTGVS